MIETQEKNDALKVAKIPRGLDERCWPRERDAGPKRERDINSQKEMVDPRERF